MAISLANNSLASTTSYQYWYRFAANSEGALLQGNASDNVATIRASFTGLTGVSFSETVPMDATYQPLSWVYQSGSIPAGLVFNSATRSFSGTPTQAVNNGTVVLAGFDATGTKIAVANVAFSIFSLDAAAKSQYVDLYAHKDKFFSQNLTIPAGIVVDHWETVDAAPAGMTYNGRYIQGTPTTPGQYPIFNVGYDYKGKIVFVYQGKITVEAGPTFDFIPDDLRSVQYNPSYGCGHGSECALWYMSGLPLIKDSIGAATDVIYSYQVENSQALPSTIAINRFPGAKNLYVGGRIFDFYSQRNVRLKAVDTDGTVGYSNWFKLGSAGPNLTCTPVGASEFFFSGSANTPFMSGNGIKVPFGTQTNGINYGLSSGQLPNGLSINSATGVVGGTPTAQDDQANIFFTATDPANPSFTPVTCGPFHFRIAAEQFDFLKTGDKPDYRVNDVMNVTYSASGGVLAGYSAVLDTANSNLPSGVTFKDNGNKTWTLSGTLATIGQNYSAKVVFTNGDGVVRNAAFNFNVKDNLKIDDVAGGVIPAARYAPYSTSSLYTFTYPDNVIGNPTFSIDGTLPDGLSLNGDKIVGATTAAEGTYGPFKVTLKDDTDQTATTAPFNITVGPRTGFNVLSTTNPVTLTVNASANVAPMTYEQETAAATLHKLIFSITPTTLPTGLAFDTDTGYLTGTPTQTGGMDGFTITATETNGSSDRITSNPFNIVIAEPTSFQDANLADLNGNVSGPKIVSADPKPVIKYQSSSIVGTVDQVQFLSASPSVPGLAFDTATGILSGNPTAEFNGPVTITFQDSVGRQGNLILPVHIYPKPAISTDKDVYTIPRLADASNYSVTFTPNAGFYGPITWGYAPSSVDLLPSGMSISDGKIIGSTTDVGGTSKTVTVRATSGVNNMTADKTITVNVTPQETPKLTIPSSVVPTFEVQENGYAVVTTPVFNPSAYLSGSYTTPVKWSLQNAPAWLAIDEISGALIAKSNPSALGTSNVTVVATDKENNTFSGTVNVKVTLSGNIIASTTSFTGIVRQNETINTGNLVFTNKVGALTLSVAPSDYAAYLVDQINGRFKGAFANAGIASWTLSAVDADGRTLAAAIPYTYTVKAPLSLDAPASISTTIKQYDPAHPLSVSFSAAQNAIGKVTYTVSGVPGKVYYKTVDSQTNLATYTNYDNGIAQIVQAAGDTIAQTEAKLPVDHMIFDEATLTLNGIPSSAGNFSIYIAAHDSHEETGYSANPSDATKDSNENATFGPVNITVAPADALSIATNKTTETINQYTSQSSIASVVSNAAYGLPVTWSRISGSLPAGLTASTGNTLTFNGYPTVTGTFGNIVYTGTDAAGRPVTTDPLSITVNARQPLALVSSVSNPRYMIVSVNDANMVVSAKNTAFGQSIGVANWTVTGTSHLPPGVTYAISDDGVTFSGTSDVIGDYSGITVTAVDSLNQSASMNVVFHVIKSPDPIALHVSNITTKVGFPVKMQAPYAAAVLTADNVYGAAIYSSTDAAAHGLAIDPATGDITGNATATGDFAFNLKVTDDTARSTTATVNVSVTPVMRVLVPDQLTVMQTKTLSSSTAVDYALGTVTYAKGQTWPAGMTLDPVTGAIGGAVTATPGTYAGLSVIATDGAGDVRSSNAFAVTVQPSPAKPVIVDISNNKLYIGDVGQNVSFTPTVTNDKTNGPWTTSGSTFTISSDVTQFGLTFNGDTGAITGKPTSSGILRNVVITVTSPYGDSSSTTPFSFYVAPAQAIAFKDVTAAYSIHTGFTKTFDLGVSNALGNVTYSTSSRSSAAINPVYDDANGNMTLNVSAASNYTLGVLVTDEVGRVATKNYTVTVTTLTVASGTVLNFSSGTAGSFSGPAISNAFGTISYSYSGLPTGLSYSSSTGVISGSSTVSGSYTVNLTVTDSADGVTATGTLTVNVIPSVISDARYWKLAWTSSSGISSISEYQIQNSAGVNQNSKIANVTLAAGSWNNAGSAGNIRDGNVGTSARLNGTSIAVVYDFGSNSANWPSVGQAYYYMSGTISNLVLYYSKDGTTWVPAAQATQSTTGGSITETMVLGK